MNKEFLEKEELASVLRGSLLEFCKYFFPILTNRKFIVSEPVGRESHHITIAKALTRASRLEIPSHRLLINTPPGSGKSLMMTMFVAWTMAKYPDSKYIYVAYSKTLADKMTEQIKRIMQLQHYDYLFDVKIRADSKAKDYFQTTAGGAVASAGSSGTITGLSAGEPGLDRWSGGLICFPFDEIIWTEQGAMKIGEIVDKKLDVKVYSMNLETREIELKEIERYFENPGSDIVEIVFEDDSTLRCTPDHKVWTENRGWIEAQDLLSSDILLSVANDRESAYSGFSCSFETTYRTVTNNSSMLISDVVNYSICSSLTNFFCKIFPCFTVPNIVNCSDIKPKFYCDFSTCSSLYSSLANFNNFIFGKSAISPLLTKQISALSTSKFGHVDKTYCLTVKDNHNMFAGLCRVIVSNCDDLTKPDEAHSSIMRQGVIDNFSQTLMQRLRGQNVPIILISQRLHEQDVCQYVIDKKDGYDWEKIIIKSIDPAGNIIYPEVFSKDMLMKRKETDPYVFSSQYQQEPVPSGGALFKPDWFVLLDEEPEFIATFVVADTAETAMTYNDATAISFFGIYEIENFGVKTGVHALHWIDAIEVHVEPKDLKDTFLSFWENCCRNKKPPRLAAIEKKSTGVSLISALSEMRAVRIMNIDRNRSSGSKTKRFLDIQPFVAERLVSLSRYAKHAEKCITHMSKITANDSHARDDLGDNLADGVRLGLIEKSIMNYSSEDNDYTDIAKSLTSHSNFVGRLRHKAYTS